MFINVDHSLRGRAFITIIIMFCLLVSTGKCMDYTNYHSLICTRDSNISTKLQQNLDQLWNVLVISFTDEIFFLVACPIILALQIIVLITYKNHSQLRVKPGNIFCGIVFIQLGLNLHLLSNAIYHVLFDGYTVMPPSFVGFCLSMGFVSAFFEMLHFLYLIMFMFYTIFLFRFSLKKKSNTFWTALHVFVIVAAVLLTIFLYFQDFMGLNFYGMCGLTAARKIQWNLTLPGIQILCSGIFAMLGIFTYVYFQKHMPGGQGFRQKKSEESRIIFMYVTGFSLFQILMSIMSLLLGLNCIQTQPIQGLNIMITITNICRLLQFAFLIFLILFNQKFRKKFQHTLRSIFRKQKKGLSLEDLLKTIQMEDVFFDQKLLEMKQKANSIDLLLLSQVYTIISGIYVAYLEYFKDIHSNLENRAIRSINYRESISFSICNKSIMSYQTQARLLVKLKILSCNIVIHCPKVFENLLAMEGLDDVFESFHIVDNSRKLSNLAEGNGGRSGQFFFFSSDNKYVIKTITIQEFEFYHENLELFYDYYKQNRNSLLAKILGLFTIKGDEMQRTYHLVLMKNILGCERRQILRIYDLKGSKYDRQVLFEQAQINQVLKLTLKDVDFVNCEHTLKINTQKASELREALRNDTMFLKSLNLLDYSLLVVRVKWNKPPQTQNFWGPLQRIPHKFAADQYYHIGVIDYMQKWDFQKKSEKWWKNFTGKKNVSAEEPNKYQQRFMEFVDEITQFGIKSNSTKYQLPPIQMKDVRAVTAPEKKKIPHDNLVDQSNEFKRRCNTEEQKDSM